MPKAPHVSLQDIADRLKVSRATVSLALRGTGDVAQSTRERICQTAREMGYSPNPIMSAFSRYRDKSVSSGAVIAVVSLKPWNKDYMEPIADVASGLGYKLDNFPLVQYPSQTHLVKVLQARGVAGVLFTEKPRAPVLDTNIWSAIKAVYCGPYPSGRDADCPFDQVRHDAFESVDLAWEKAVRAGFTRIGLICPPEGGQLSQSDQQMVAAYLYKQSTASPSLPRLTPFVTGLSTSADAISTVREWLERHRPEVILGSFHWIYSYLVGKGIRIPKDFQFIALRADPKNPEVAGCQSFRDQIHRVALRHLHSLILYHEEWSQHTTTTLVVHPVWHEGNSFTQPDIAH